jgi:hypothetical protein
MVKLILSIVILPLLLAVPAVAQSGAADGQVVIPWGNLLASSADILVTLAASALALALSMLPASINSLIKTWRVEQLLEKAVAYGVNMVAGAAKGQELSVPVANKVIEQALEYAVENGSAALIKWMGGTEAVQKKIIARLEVEKDAGAASLG